MQTRTEKYTRLALQAKNKILSDYSDILDHEARRKYIQVLEGVSEETLSVTDFRVPSWSSQNA